MALDLLVNVDFLDEEAIGYLNGLRSVAVEKRAAKIERIGEAVRWVDTHHESSFSHSSQVNARSRGDAGFANPALAAEQQDSHADILALLFISEHFKRPLIENPGAG